MAGYICVGMLAAFGALCALWCLFGWLLTGCRGGVLIYRGGSETDERFFVRRYLWLRGMGLLNCPLVLVAREPEEPERRWLERQGIILCGPAELSARLGIGAEEIDGTGNGDPPGCHQRRGVSEL